MNSLLGTIPDEMGSLHHYEGFYLKLLKNYHFPIDF